jgi:hypothetical protein
VQFWIPVSGFPSTETISIWHGHIVRLLPLTIHKMKVKERDEEGNNHSNLYLCCLKVIMSAQARFLMRSDILAVIPKHECLPTPQPR